MRFLLLAVLAALSLDAALSVPAALAPKEPVVRLSFPAKTSGPDGLAVIACEIVRRKQ